MIPFLICLLAWPTVMTSPVTVTNCDGIFQLLNRSDESSDTCGNIFKTHTSDGSNKTRSDERPPPRTGPPSHILELVISLFVAVSLNILLVETVLANISSKTKVRKEEENMLDTISSSNMTKNNEELMEAGKRKLVGRFEDLAGHLASFCGLLLDRQNWHLGQRDDSNIFVPTWSEGGIVTGKLQELKYFYREIRRDKSWWADNKQEGMSLRFLLYYIRVWSKEKIREEKEKDLEDELVVKEAEAISHYSHELIYNVLEKEVVDNNVVLEKSEEKAEGNQIEYAGNLVAIEDEQNKKGNNQDLWKEIKVSDSIYVNAQNPSPRKEVDLVIKNSLTPRDSPMFYGELIPYLDVVRLLTSFSCCKSKIVKQFLRLAAELIDKIPGMIKYLAVMIIFILGWYLDFIKDILLASDVTILFDNFWSIKGQIVTTLWVTTFLSQIIIAIRIFFFRPIRLFGKDSKHISWKMKIFINAMFIVFAPLSPAILFYLHNRAQKQLEHTEKILQRDFGKELSAKNFEKQLEMFEEREIMVKEKFRLGRLVTTAYQIDTVFENTPQLLIPFLIVLADLSSSKCPELDGIDAIFETNKSTNTWTTFLFYFSICWSMKSICLGMFSTYLLKKHYSVGDNGKVLVFLMYLVGSTARLMAMIFFLAPYLGLFGLMLPFLLDSSKVYDQDVFGDLPLVVSATWYTGLPKEAAYLCLASLPLVHSILVFTYKLVGVDGFPMRRHNEGSSLWSRTRQILLGVLHSFSGMLSPMIWRDWDKADKNFNKKWGQVRREYLFELGIFLLLNLILLLPLLHTSVRVLARQSLLPQPPLSEEQAVVTMCKWFLALPVLFVILACVQFKLFLVYNTKGHPWYWLLDSKTDSV